MKRLNNVLLKIQWVNEEISKEVRKYLKMEIQQSKICGMQQSSSKRKVYNSRALLQETRRISNNLTYYLKEFEKEEHKNPKVSRRK